MTLGWNPLPDGLFRCRRELVVYLADLTTTEWYGAGGAPPSPTLSESVDMRWVDREESLRRPELFPDLSAEVVRERYGSGARCLVGWDHDEERVVYRLWATAGETFVGWIFTKVRALPASLLIFDVLVDPSRRGGQLHWAGAAHACRLAVDMGRPGIMACVEEHEYYPFVKKYASQGLGLCKPEYLLKGWGIGRLTWHTRCPPSERSLRFYQNLRRRYGSGEADRSP